MSRKRRKQLESSSLLNENTTELATKIEDESKCILNITNKAAADITEYYNELIDAEQTEALDMEVKDIIASYKRASTNIRKSYFKITDMNDELGARWRDIKKSKTKKLIPTAPANAIIDAQENTLQHFARGLNLYKILLILYVGSFVGVVTELIWCFIRHGRFESRAGLVYGPFNLLYGVAAVVLTVGLYRYRNRTSWLSFLGGMLLASVIEYVCSWGQELLFGSRSWDYSMVPFNLNGRICLLYSTFWGLMSIGWIKNLYPRIAKLILKIPNKIGKIMTWVILGFFIFNSLMSAVAVYRWSERVKGVEPSNVVWEFFDKRFTNERLERIYANMRFGPPEELTKQTK